MARKHESPEVKEKSRLNTARWREANREHHRAYSREYRRKNIEKVKANSRRALYGETPSAPPNCEACGIPFISTKKGPCCDHNHTTGGFRGWLCMHCNFALGHTKDSRDRLQLLINYLDRVELCS